MDSWRIIDVQINMGEKWLNEAKMRDSYLEREVPTTVEEEHDDVNETDILGLINDGIEFQVHIREEMVCNVERQCGDDQAYVEYPEELKQKGKKVTMKTISHT
jgi:hypothetical protein